MLGFTALWLFFATYVAYVVDKNTRLEFGHVFNVELGCSLLGVIISAHLSGTAAVVGAFIGLVASWALVAWNENGGGKTDEGSG